MDPVVRLALTSDIAELDRLQTIARDSLTEVRGGMLRLRECPVVDDWQAALDDPRLVVTVGTLDDVVVAYMVMVLDDERERGVITHAFVQIEARELGLGDTLVEHAMQACRDAGLPGIEATALPGDRETKNMFERAGMTARKLTVYKGIGG